jgi:hypothetical protein
MKKLLIALCIFSQTTLTFAAGLTLAQGAFWQAPQISEITKKLTPLEGELLKRCESYKSFYSIYKELPVSSMLITKVESKRKNMLTVNQATFKATFTIADMPDYGFLEVEAKANNDVEENLRLPFFNQPIATTFAFLKDAGDIQSIIANDSYSDFSKKLGLEESTAIFSYDKNGHFILAVDGADLACDLLAKKAVLKVKFKSFVRIPKDKITELNSLYNSQIAPQLDKVLATNESTNVKAARLGYRLGQILDEKNVHYSDSQVEVQVGNMMNLLFSQNSTGLLKTTSYVEEEHGKKVINAGTPIEGMGLTLNMGI